MRRLSEIRHSSQKRRGFISIVYVVTTSQNILRWVLSSFKNPCVEIFRDKESYSIFEVCENKPNLGVRMIARANKLKNYYLQIIEKPRISKFE